MAEAGRTAGRRNRTEPGAAANRSDPALAAGDPGGRVLRPASEEELVQVLREAAAAGTAVVFRGGATRLHLGQPPEHAETPVDLRGLSGIIEHHVRDLTVEARAGTTVGALNRALAPRRQFLALDPSFPDRATLGGVIAAGEPGIRTVPGSRPGDLLLGLRAVLAGGTRVRSGGRVVKNVTGYQLNRLFTGSLGTLGAITRVTLRLRALPETSRTLVAALPVTDSARRFADRVLAAAAEAAHPDAVAVVPPGTGLPGLPEDGGFRLAVRFAGLREEAAASTRGIAARTGGTGHILEGDAEAVFWAGVRDFAAAVPAARGELGVVVRGPARAMLRTAWRLAALGPPVAFPDQRRALASLPPDRFPDALGAARREEAVRLEVQTAPAGWKTAHGVFHPPPSGPVRALSRRLKQALDPEGVLAPGRLPC